jgi:glycosyltransferase involved in cell wall biosynthesis
VKILIVQDTDWLKRNPAQQHHLADRLSLRGHEIRVIDYDILWRTDGKRQLLSQRQVFRQISKTVNGANITVIRPGILRIPGLDYISPIFSHRTEIRRQLREFAPDVILGIGVLTPYLGAKAARRNRLPFFYYKLDASHRVIPTKILQPIGRIIEKITFKVADGVLVINERLRDYAIRMGASPDRTQVLGAGINTEQFSLAVNGDAIRKKHGLAEEDVVLFFMGWLYNFSGLKEVALKLAQISDDRLKLLIVGEGDAYEDLQKIQKKYKLQGRVILTGKKSYREIPAFVAASDICLLPAYPEEKIMRDIVPIKLYEYMAMKKPVIATRLPGVMREFGEGNGVVYIDRPEDVVEKALELVASKKLSELGAKARRFVEKRSWDNITDEFESILKEAISNSCKEIENENY